MRRDGRGCGLAEDRSGTINHFDPCSGLGARQTIDADRYLKPTDEWMCLIGRGQSIRSEPGSQWRSLQGLLPGEPLSQPVDRCRATQTDARVIKQICVRRTAEACGVSDDRAAPVRARGK
jgi:hypothetical protein